MERNEGNVYDDISLRNHPHGANVFSYILTLQGVTECYECHPKPTQRTFPGCTIRNTPSEPIHCIVWAKYLFK